jgi:hypothetical protein
MGPKAVLIYIVAAMLALPIGLRVYGARFNWIDVALASVGGSILILVPKAGPVLTFMAIIAILHWRTRADAYPDLFYIVLVATMVQAGAYVMLRVIVPRLAV